MVDFIVYKTQIPLKLPIYSPCFGKSILNQDSHFDDNGPDRIRTAEDDSRRRPHNSKEGSVDWIIFSHFVC